MTKEPHGVTDNITKPRQANSTTLSMNTDTTQPSGDEEPEKTDRASQPEKSPPAPSQRTVNAQHTLRAVSELRPHPYNVELYGEETLDDAFLANVKERGIYVPLIVTPKGDIISGHRRYAAAVKLSIAEVPVDVRNFADDLAEKEALIDANRQRVKTNVQIASEYAALKEIESARAKQRMATNDGQGRKKFAQGEGGKSRDKAAEFLGLSGVTLEKGEQVLEQIKKLRGKKGKESKATELENALNQSFDAGYKKAVALNLIKPTGGTGRKTTSTKAAPNAAAEIKANASTGSAPADDDASAEGGNSTSDTDGVVTAREHAIELSRFVQKNPAKKLSKGEREDWQEVLEPVIEWFNTLAA